MVRLIRSVVHILFHFFRFAIPWLLRVMGFTVQLIGIFVSSVWRNTPTALRKIAERCQKLAADNGFPTIVIEYLYYAAYTVALVTILGMWVLASFLTVYTVKWIFRV